MKIGVFISIRNKSTRFPGKVLMKINGRCVTDLLIERLKKVKSADGLFLTTSPDSRDDILCEIASGQGIEWFRGDPEDKLKRYLDACNYFDLDGCVIVDGDDTFCFPEFVDQTISYMKQNFYDYITIDGLPLGAIGFGVTKAALAKIMEIKTETDTEVWGHLFADNPEFQCFSPKVEDSLFNHPEIRLTLDYQQDYQLFCQIYEELGMDFESSKLMQLLAIDKPGLNQVNAEAQKLYEKKHSEKQNINVHAIN